MLPSPPPLDVDLATVIGVGTALWLAAFVVALILRPHGDDLWLWACLAGAVLGGAGFVVMTVQKRATARRTDGSR